jgi:hypothetical protein
VIGAAVTCIDVVTVGFVIEVAVIVTVVVAVKLAGAV